MEVLKYLKSAYPFTNGQNFARFVGAVDIFMASKKKREQGIIASIFIIPEQKWYYPKNTEEFADIAINHIEFYQDKPKPMKQPNRTEYRGPKLTDNSKMPYGKHQGEKMANVPPEYLIWCFENNKCNPAVAFYVSENLDNLRKEVENGKKGIR